MSGCRTKPATRGVYVKAYESLMRGQKAVDLTRATRFVYLELCMAARKEGRVQPDGSALVTLGSKGTPAQATAALLGGATMEVVHALKALVAAEMVAVVESTDRRAIAILHYVDWAGEGPARPYEPRKSKSAKVAPDSAPADTSAPVGVPATDTDSNARVEKWTSTSSFELGPGYLGVRSELPRSYLSIGPNDSEHLRHLEKRREEKRRSPLSPPASGGVGASHPGTGPDAVDHPASDALTRPDDSTPVRGASTDADASEGRPGVAAVPSEGRSVVTDRARSVLDAVKRRAVS